MYSLSVFNLYIYKDQNKTKTKVVAVVAAVDTDWCITVPSLLLAEA